MTEYNEMHCTGCAGPLAVAHRPLRGASSDALIGLALAGAAAFALFSVMKHKDKGILKGIFGRSRRRRRSRR